MAGQVGIFAYKKPRFCPLPLRVRDHGWGYAAHRAGVVWTCVEQCCCCGGGEIGAAGLIFPTLCAARKRVLGCVSIASHHICGSYVEVGSDKNIVLYDSTPLIQLKPAGLLCAKLRWRKGGTMCSEPGWLVFGFDGRNGDGQVEKDARLSHRATVILLLLGLILVGCDKYTQCICFGGKVATCRYGLYERTRHRTDASDTQVKSGTPPRPESPPVFLFASRFDNPQAAYTLLRVGSHLAVQWCKSARYRPRL